MSIEMQHSERLTQSIDGLRASGKLEAGPVGCGTLLLAVAVFLLATVPLLALAPDAAWLTAFEQEHGYAPDADPVLLAIGYTPQEALAEHLAAREWSMQHPQMSEDLWRWQWYERHYKLCHSDDPEELPTGIDPVTGDPLYPIEPETGIDPVTGDPLPDDLPTEIDPVTGEPLHAYIGD